MTTDDLSDFELEFHDFISRFEVAFDLGCDALQQAFAYPMAFQLQEFLELDENNVWSNEDTLLMAWGIFGSIDFFSDGRRQFIEELRHTAGVEIAGLFDIFAKGRFGAWEVSEDEGRLRAVAIDGQSERRSIELDALTDSDWEDLAAGSVYAGWSVAIGDGHAIILGDELYDETRRKFYRAARRGAWGDGDDFRLHHYEQDLLALHLDSTSFDTEHCAGRVFLDSTVCQYKSWQKSRLREGLKEAIFRYGFPSLSTTSEPLDPYRPKLDGAPVTTQLAGAVGAGLDELKQDLFHLRGEAPTLSRYVIFAGPHGLSYLFPDAELLRDFHLQLDGAVEHPKLKYRGNYPLAATDIGDEWLKKTGARLEWSVERTLNWACGRIDDESFEQLREVIDHFYLALRWAALVDLHAKEPSSWLGEITYDDLICGIRTRLSDSAQQTALKAFEEPARGVWTRITASLQKAGHFARDRPLRIGDLPRPFTTVMKTPGIGDITLSHLQRALLDYVRRWPESAGYDTRQAARCDEANTAISEGLDELNDLF